MPKSLIIILMVMSLGAWFFVVERQSFGEKIFIILCLLVVFATYRVLTGASMDQIFTPIISFFKT